MGIRCSLAECYSGATMQQANEAERPQGACHKLPMMKDFGANRHRPFTP
jgi:hypothetical protein